MERERERDSMKQRKEKCKEINTIRKEKERYKEPYLKVFPNLLKYFKLTLKRSVVENYFHDTVDDARADIHWEQ